MNEIDLSIVIPTKNRYEYLQVLLTELVKETSKKFEIIIQDNSDDNSGFLKFIEQLNDNRIFYYHVSGWLSVIDNCDKGVSEAKGEYICMLGDDDGILINKSLEIIEYFKKHKIDSAVVNKITFAWPDVTHKNWNGLSGKVDIPKFSNKFVYLDINQLLKTIVHQGGSMGLGDLPRVYHGFVSRAIMNQLKKETGSYFPGPSPDMANAVGLTKFTNRAVCVDFPCVISGQGKKSTGGQGSNKEHHGSIKSQAHLPKDTADRWSKNIPFFWSGPTIYSESARRALEATNTPLELNYNYLYACCLVYEPLYKNEVKGLVKNGKGLFDILKITYYRAIILWKRGINYLFNIYNRKLNFSKSESVYSKDIGEVIIILKKLGERK